MAEFKGIPEYMKVTKKRKTGPKSVGTQTASRPTETKVIVYRSMPTETKYIANNDWTAETLDDRVTGASFNFNMLRLAQGTATNQRIGSQVFAKGLMIKFLTKGSTGVSSEFNRIDFWMDLQPSAASPTWGSLYDGGATRVDEINASIAETSRKRFKLLRSFVFDHQQYLMTTTGPIITQGSHIKKLWIPLKGRRLHYDGTGAGNPDGGCNVFAVAWGTLNASTTTIYMTSLFSFNDA